jgi:hypothetical protein
MNTAFFTSGEILGNIVLGIQPGAPAVNIGMVDVRDVAKAHLEAVKRENVKDQRFILVSECIWFG